MCFKGNWDGLTIKFDDSWCCDSGLDDKGLYSCTGQDPYHLKCGLPFTVLPGQYFVQYLQCMSAAGPGQFNTDEQSVNRTELLKGYQVDIYEFVRTQNITTEVDGENIRWAMVSQTEKGVEIFDGRSEGAVWWRLT